MKLLSPDYVKAAIKLHSPDFIEFKLKELVKEGHNLKNLHADSGKVSKFLLSSMLETFEISN